MPLLRFLFLPDACQSKTTLLGNYSLLYIGKDPNPITLALCSPRSSKKRQKPPKTKRFTYF